MFDKIIEKIEEEQEDTAFKMIRNDVFSLDCEYAGWVKGTNYAIEVLKEEENKPFNPESFGFTIDFIKLDYLESWLRLKDDSYNAIHNVSDNIYNITTENYSIKNIKIKSNFQGEIILKALGVIE